MFSLLFYLVLSVCLIGDQVKIFVMVYVQYYKGKEEKRKNTKY